MMAKYRKRPIAIEAIQMSEPFTTQTMEGELSGKAGDWLITGVGGEQYPCDDGVFRQTYDAVGEAGDDGFEQVMERTWRLCEYGDCVEYTCTGGISIPTELLALLDSLAAAHADVVAERDSYRDVAHKLARYVLPDSDTLTIRQLVETADAVLEAAEEDPDDIQA